MTTMQFRNAAKQVVVTMQFNGWEAGDFAILGDDSQVTDAELLSLANLELPEGWTE